MFYSVPVYLNPAFAGSKHANRALLHQRWQWPNQEARYTTTQFSFDTYASKYNSGFGIVAIQDYAAKNKLTSTYLSLNYSYELALSSRHTLRFGLQGGVIQRTVGNLILSSDIDNNGVFSAHPGQTIWMPDIGAGVIFYDRNLYLGLTVNHINRPREAFYGNGQMPAKFTLVGGYKIPIPLSGGGMKSRGLHGAPDYLYLTPTFTYKHAGGTDANYLSKGADQLDIGLYLTRSYFIAGVWYRGVPWQLYKEGNRLLPSNYDAVVFLVGANYNGIGFGYSYDLTVSKQTTTTGGAHELNLTFVFRTKRKKPARALPCPDFEYDVLEKAGQGMGK